MNFEQKKKTMQTCGLSEAFKTDGGHTLQMENKLQTKKNAVFTVKTDKTKQQKSKNIKKIKPEKVHLSIGNCYCEHSTEIRRSREERSKENNASLQHLTRKPHCSIYNTTVDAVKRMLQWRISSN